MNTTQQCRVNNIAVFYGHVASNLGDLAINVGELIALKQAYPDAEVKFVGLHVNEGPAYDNALAETARVGASTWTIYRTSFHRASRYLSKPTQFLIDCGVQDADLVILASGEHLFAYEENLNTRALYWRTLPAMAAKAAGKRCLLFPSTFGPYETDASKQWMAALVAILDGYAVRESGSARLLEDTFGFQSKQLPDPAFFLQPARRRAQSKTGIDILGLAMRAEDWGIRLSKEQRADTLNITEANDAGEQALEFAVAAVCEFLDQKPDGQVRIFVQTEADRQLAERIFKSLEKQGRQAQVQVLVPETIPDYLDALADVDALIASRFHALIMGLIVHVPVYGVYFPVHGHKIPGLFSWLGIASSCRAIQSTPSVAATDAVKKLLTSPFNWTAVDAVIHEGRQALCRWIGNTPRKNSSENLYSASLALNGLASELIHAGYEQEKVARANKLLAKFDKELGGLQKEHDTALKKNSARLQLLQSDLDRQSHEYTQVLRDATQLRGQLETIRASATYQLAAETARTLRSKHKLFTLPMRLYAIYSETRANRSGPTIAGELDKGNSLPTSLAAIEKSSASPSDAAAKLMKVSKALSEKGRFDDACEVASRALELHRSEATLRAMFWALQNAGRVEDAFQTAQELQQYLGDKPSLMQKERLDFIRSQPSFQLNLQKLLPVKAVSRALEPVQGRLAYILHNSLPFSSGGYSTRAHGLARGLVAQGHEVVAFTRAGYPLDIIKNLDAGAVSKVQDIDGITYVRSFEPSRKNLRMQDFIPIATDVMEAHFRHYKPEVVIAASNYICALPALFAAHRLGLPFIYEVRGFWEITRLSREPGFINHASYKIQELMEAFVCKQADKVLTLTDAMKVELIRRGVHGDKIDIIPNACQPELFKPRQRDDGLAANLGIPANVPVIGYIGTFVDYEGLDDLARACGILKSRGVEFRLLMVGNENVSGTERGPIGQAVLTAAKERNFLEWLIMPGRVPHEEVAAYYSLIDIAPFPRKPWPVCEMVSPMKPLEAMAMEKTVVVSSVSALAEMVGHGDYGVIFEKGNEQALADALERVLTDAALRHQIGKAGREYVLAERTWLRSAQRFASALSQILLTLEKAGES